MPAGGPATLLLQRQRLHLCSLSAWPYSVVLHAVILSLALDHLNICNCSCAVTLSVRLSWPLPGSCVICKLCCLRMRQAEAGRHAC